MVVEILYREVNFVFSRISASVIFILWSDDSMDIEFVFTYNESEDAPSFFELTKKYIGASDKDKLEETEPTKSVSFLQI